MAGPAQTPATPNQVTTDLSPSKGGRFSSAFPLWDGTGRVLVSWDICRLAEPDPADPTATIFVPCTDDKLAATNPAPVVAPPLYGIWMYDPQTQTQLPIVTGEEGVLIGEVVAAQPRANPQSIPDKIAGVDFDDNLVAEGVGILNIRSVYDVDGVAYCEHRQRRRSRGNTGREPPGALPARRESRGDSGSRRRRHQEHGVRPQHPAGHARDPGLRADRARWLGARESARERGARGQRARRERPAHHRAASELAAGYPGPGAEVQRLPRRQSGLSHGRSDAFNAAYAGAPSTGVPFPNTVSMFSPDVGETMAETRTRVSCQTDCAALTPSVDVVYDDVWTDSAWPSRVALFRIATRI